MYQNPIELEQRAQYLQLDQRINGLNKTSEIKSKHFGLKNDELKYFIKEMRDSFNEHHEENKKFLGVIFYMANIDKCRHDCQFEELNTTEIFNIVKAINHIKAISAFLPKNLALPLN